MDVGLRVQNLRGGYPKSFVVEDISFSLSEGEVLSILGPNGCGKSTLLKLLLGFLPKTGGEIFAGGVSTKSMSRRQTAKVFSYIPQSDNLAFSYTSLEMVAMARTCHLGPFASPGEEDNAAAMECLQRMNIAHLAEKLYTKLSGGQRQLVLIARALCQESRVLIMDEPTASLDFYHQKLVLDAIRMIAAAKCIVILTTHSPSQPFAIADRTLLMNRGRVAACGSPDEVLTPPSLEEVFGLPMDVLSVRDRGNNTRRICVAI